MGPAIGMLKGIVKSSAAHGLRSKLLRLQFSGVHGLKPFTKTFRK